MSDWVEKYRAKELQEMRDLIASGGDYGEKHEGLRQATRFEDDHEQCDWCDSHEDVRMIYCDDIYLEEQGNVLEQVWLCKNCRKKDDAIKVHIG